MDNVSQVPFVLRCQVDAPGNGQLEFDFFTRNVRFQNLDGLGIRDTGEARRLWVGNSLEPLPRARRCHGGHHFPLVCSSRLIFQEIKLGGAVFKSFADAESDKVLCAAHVVAEVGKGDFRFDHPEFRQMARGVAVLGAKGGPEGVHGGQGAGVVLGCGFLMKFFFWFYKVEFSFSGFLRFSMEKKLLLSPFSCPLTVRNAGFPKKSAL